MEKKCMKKLSLAEEKKLIICRERAFDLLKRLEWVSDFLSKKEWPASHKIDIEHRHVLDCYRLLQSIESDQFLLKKK